MDVSLFFLHAAGWWIITGVLMQVIVKAVRPNKPKTFWQYANWYSESIALAMWVTLGVWLVGR